jgi:hypothetical protein
MIKDALQYLISLAIPTVREIDGLQWCDRNLVLVHKPKVSPVALHTLTSFVLYVSRLLEDGWAGEVIVVSPTDIQAIGPLEKDNNREVYVLAKAERAAIKDGTWMPHDAFMILLQTCFYRDEQLVELMSLLGNIRGEEIKTSEDDGVTQTALVKKGAHVQRTPIENPISLRPLRTFPEIIPPQARYTLRLQRGNDGSVSVALFEVQDGQWNYNAVCEIADFLTKAGIKVPVFA